MRLKKVLFLAAYTPRSQAYLQALAKAGLYPENILLFGKENAGLPGQASVTIKPSGDLDLFVPNFSQNLKDTVKRFQAGIHELADYSVNDPAVCEYIEQVHPRLVIYSGYGGQIVAKQLLSVCPFLHMHSGWLPEYRGSTTLYYSWLKENYCAVSAILLSREIDQGVIVGRKKYPPPDKDVDPDYVYDPVIRADFLVSVIKDYVENNGFNNTLIQRQDSTPYYVIHPVLKHLARLRGESLYEVRII